MATDAGRTVRGWMQLFRPHSLGLTAPIAIIGYALTHTGWQQPDYIFWTMYSILWGFTGNIHNAVVDYSIDTNDPHKSHFPLVSGLVTIRRASAVSTIMLLGLWITGVAGTGFDPKWSLLVTFGIAAGLSYNWTSKAFGASGLMAGLSFPVPFLLAAHDITNTVILVYAYLVVQFMMQNGFSGGYKDLGSDAKNMVTVLGVRLQNGTIQQSLWGAMFSVGTRILMLAIMLAVSGSMTSKILVMAVWTALMVPVALQVTSTRYDKKRFMSYFVIIEMLSYYLLLCGIISGFGPYQVVFLMVFPPVAFMLLNRMSWGTTIIPKT